MQAERSDFLEEGAESGGGNGSSQSLYEGRVLLQRRIEGLANSKDVYRESVSKDTKHGGVKMN